MRISNLKEMKKGWFVGDFEPSLYHTAQVEAAVKRYRSGDREEAHFHKIATEITVVTKGKVKMNGRIYQEGDIIIMEPYEVTDFEALTDAENTVLKIPGALNDKYPAGGDGTC